ncbi:MAG TPA: ferredoxin [Longimicrobiales bacterium]
MERTFGPFTLRIDLNLCVGFGDCVAEAAEVLELTDDGLVRFCDAAPPEAPREVLAAACRSCPVDALAMYDSTGAQVAP